MTATTRFMLRKSLIACLHLAKLIKGLTTWIVLVCQFLCMQGSISPGNSNHYITAKYTLTRLHAYSVTSFLRDQFLAWEKLSRVCRELIIAAISLVFERDWLSADIQVKTWGTNVWKRLILSFVYVSLNWVNPKSCHMGCDQCAVRYMLSLWVIVQAGTSNQKLWSKFRDHIYYPWVLIFEGVFRSALIFLIFVS